MKNTPTPASPNFIYLMHHPESLHMYIGKTSKGMQRPGDHVHPSSLKKYAGLFRTKWVKSILARGLKPEFIVLEEFESPDALDEAERFYIAYFRSIGASLMNGTDGGDGFTGTHSREARAKMSKVWEERLAADATGVGERMAAQSQQFWDDPVASAGVRAQRASTRDIPRDAETREKISKKLTGRVVSDEARARMREAARLRWATPGYREKQIAVQKASHSTDEARAKAAEWGKQASHDTHKTPEFRAKQSEITKAAMTPELREEKSATALAAWKTEIYRAHNAEGRKREKLKDGA